MRNHLLVARNGAKNHRCNWVRSVLSRGFIPTVALVGEVDGDGCKEEIAWIKYFRDEGVNLVNETIGGEGRLGYKASEKTLCKMRDAIKRQIFTKGHPALGYHHSAESIAKTSASKTGKHRSEETCQKISETLKLKKLPAWNRGKHPSKQTIQKNRDAHMGKMISEETRKKMSKSSKTCWAKRKNKLQNNEAKI